MVSSTPTLDTPPSSHSATAQPDTSSTDHTMAAVMSTARLSPSLSPLTTENLSILDANSPPHSGLSSPGGLSARRPHSPRLSIDLKNMPPLSSPSPPSNTLLITRLDDPKIFHPASLATIRQHLNSIAPLNSFSPLKSMARLIVSFYDEASAIKVRQEIDRTAFTPTCICKCYFGEPTPIGEEKKKYLDRPDAGRLFFISPPPSPPVGWESRTEDAPNTLTHADDLMAKLAKLTGKMDSETAVSPSSPVDNKKPEIEVYTAEELAAKTQQQHSSSHKRALSSVSDDLNSAVAAAGGSGSPFKMRSRSSTLIYDPKLHGDSPGLPAVMLETEDESDVELDTEKSPTIMAHTSRPPVELMESS